MQSDRILRERPLLLTTQPQWHSESARSLPPKLYRKKIVNICNVNLILRDNISHTSESNTAS